MMKTRFCLMALCAAATLLAQVAEQPKTPFRHKVAFVAGFGEGSDKAAQVKNFAATFLNSHAATFGFASKTRPGEDRFRVFDASGTLVYEGGDDREAEAAVVNALTEMPVSGQLINGVVLKKFKAAQKTYVMGKKKGEGADIAPFKAALKSKKPAEVEEAQAILASIETAKKNLEDEIAENLAAGEKDFALRNIRWFCQTWPSEKDKYAADFKKLAADPEAVKGEKLLLMPPKKRK